MGLKINVMKKLLLSFGILKVQLVVDDIDFKEIDVGARKTMHLRATGSCKFYSIINDFEASNLEE